MDNHNQQRMVEETRSPRNTTSTSTAGGRLVGFLTSRRCNDMEQVMRMLIWWMDFFFCKILSYLSLNHSFPHIIYKKPFPLIMISNPDNVFDNIINITQPILGPIPTDGVAITVATFLLSPPETRFRNALIVGGIHYLLHHSVEKFDCPSSNNLSGAVLKRALPQHVSPSDRLW